MVMMKNSNRQLPTTTQTHCIYHVLLLLFLVVNFLPFCQAEVIELDVSNFESTLTSQPWTCVLFYDGMDYLNRADHDQLLERLDAISHDHADAGKFKFAVARLDIRRHSYYRRAYTDDDESDQLLEAYYTHFPNNPNSLGLTALSPSSLLQFVDLFWDNKLVLMANDLNIYSELRLHKLTASLANQMDIATHWLEEHVKESSANTTVLVTSPRQEQDILQKNSKATMDKETNDFDFEGYKREEEEEEEEENLLLETGSEDADDLSFYKYERREPNQNQEAHDYLVELSQVIYIYLMWTESYEVLWDEDRKAREDAQTNYGKHLTQLHQSVKELIDSVFGEEEDEETGAATTNNNTSGAWSMISSMLGGGGGSGGDNNNTKKEAATKKENVQKAKENIKLKSTEGNKYQSKGSPVDIPPLKGYLNKFVLGIGRSPKAFKEYIEKEMEANFGDAATTAEQRRNLQKKSKVELALTRHLQEYMEMWIDTHRNTQRYIIRLTNLVQKWHNLLVEFHAALHTSFLAYLEANPSRQTTEFPRASLSVLDLNDASNAPLLSNYTAFHEQYTRMATPVVLSNVKMLTGKKKWTFEKIVKACGKRDVTHEIQSMLPVGEVSTADWAGMEEYLLEWALVMPHRRIPEDDDDDEEDEDEEAVDEDDDFFNYDESLTLEQFAILVEHKVKNLYLYDWNLLGRCDAMLYKNTLYESTPTVQIPKVLGSFDLMQRMTVHQFADFWPALYAGTPGTHAKLHTDPQSMGFFVWLQSGRKRWTVYHPSERPYLYPRILKNSYVPDVLGMDRVSKSGSSGNGYLSKRFPLLHRTEQVYEFIQEPGQLVYIPPNCPYAEENIHQDGLTVGIAMNIIPEEVAFGAHLYDQIHKYREFGSVELALKYKLFADEAESCQGGDDGGLYMSLAEFKAQQ